jgi:phosphatidylglycerophosphatase A
MKIDALWRSCTTLGPIGYLPASGTLASLVTLPLIYALRFISWTWYGVFLALMSVGSFLVIYRTCREYLWHDDPPMIVLDEVMGMLFLFWLLPWRTDVVILAFLLFRLLDISKALGISYLDEWPGAIGILGDDLLAAAYAQILVHLYIWLS